MTTILYTFYFAFLAISASIVIYVVIRILREPSTIKKSPLKFSLPLSVSIFTTIMAGILYGIIQSTPHPNFRCSVDRFVAPAELNCSSQNEQDFWLFRRDGKGMIFHHGNRASFKIDLPGTYEVSHITPFWLTFGNDHSNQTFVFVDRLPGPGVEERVFNFSFKTTFFGSTDEEQVIFVGNGKIFDVHIREVMTKNMFSLRARQRAENTVVVSRSTALRSPLFPKGGFADGQIVVRIARD